MKRCIPVIFVIFGLLLVCIIADSCSAEDQSFLRLSAVYPTSSSEGFALTNYGQITVELSDYYVSDGEGTVVFNESIKLESMRTLFILKGEPPVWLNDVDYLIYGSSGIVMKRLALNDSGDDLYLYRKDVLIDSFVYGDISSEVKGWKGDAVAKIPKNRIAERTSSIDTDTADDWAITNHLKIYDFPNSPFSAEVIPFVFPDSKGIQVLSELDNAESSVDISVYLLNHPGIVSILDHLLSAGVQIKILIEGAPAGGLKDDELGLLTALYKHGADIRLIHSGDNGKRFSYLHNKYAVIDSRTVIITSENWQKVSFESNRGWGAVIRSTEYALFMEQVFEDDFNGYDTDSLHDMYPKIKPYSIDTYSPIDKEFESYSCTVFPVLSPDNSLLSLNDFICSAEKILYIQQLEVESSWLDGDDNPLVWAMERSFEGVDCRLMLNSTFDDEDGGAAYLQYELENYDIDCKLFDSSSLLHNKGLLKEDAVWIGSVNWTENSLNYNRETAVIIYSSEISNYFKSFFLTDWGEDPVETMEIRLRYDSNVVSGDIIVLDASESIVKEGAVFYWDLDYDGTYERTGKKIPVILPAGINNISLRIVCGDEVIEDTFQIRSFETPDTVDIPWKYLPIILICIGIIVVKLFFRKNEHR